MIELVRTSSEHPEFVSLVQLLDADLAVRDGDDHSFYAQFNRIDALRCVVLAFEDGRAVGCGAIKEIEPEVMEVKRMYTLPSHRGRGIAGEVLSELERWAVEMSGKRLLLETGLKQPEAIALYEKGGFTRIPNYGQYAGIDNSVCFGKHLLNRA